MTKRDIFDNEIKGYIWQTNKGIYLSNKLKDIFEKLTDIFDNQRKVYIN